MSNEERDTQVGLEDGAGGGPGAPTPLAALEVCKSLSVFLQSLTHCQGVSGLTARDIKLLVDGGYHTVESIAYTYVEA